MSSCYSDRLIYLCTFLHSGDSQMPVTLNSTCLFLGMFQNKAYYRHKTLHDNRINADETISSGHRHN